VGCRVRLFPRERLREGRRAYERWLNHAIEPAAIRREAFVECPIAHPTLMIRREVLAAHRYRAMGWPEDYDLLLRLLADGRELAVHPRRLLGWRDSPGRLSRAALQLCKMLDFAPDESIRNKILVDNPARLFGFDN